MKNRLVILSIKRLAFYLDGQHITNLLHLQGGIVIIPFWFMYKLVWAVFGGSLLLLIYVNEQVKVWYEVRSLTHIRRWKAMMMATKMSAIYHSLVIFLIIAEIKNFPKNSTYCTICRRSCSQRRCPLGCLARYQGCSLHAVAGTFYSLNQFLVLFFYLSLHKKVFLDLFV